MNLKPFRCMRMILTVFLVFASVLSGRGQEAKLSGMTDAGFAKWLTGTEWKGENAGKHGQLWFATQGIAI